ncbi:MAG: PASTA domain-containing protein [Pseudonocardiales bacterium]|nr:PASTA domain-containing protein [Pseudonocardiales bacterium]
MAEQHSTDDHTSGETLPRIRWRVRSESTRTTAGPSGGVTLTRPLGTILAVLILWFCQHHGAVQDQSLASGTYLLAQSGLQHHELTTGATGDAVVYHPRAMVSLSVPPPPTPVPPAPVPAIPRPAPVVPVVPRVAPVVPVVPRPAPVVPHSVPVVPYPVPAPATPTWVFPRPIPVVPAPTRVFPPPVVVLEPVPSLVGDDVVTAEQVLIQHGLTMGSISKQESNLPAGTIVYTIPRANTAVPAGTAINLVVAA